MRRMLLSIQPSPRQSLRLTGRDPDLQVGDRSLVMVSFGSTSKKESMTRTQITSSPMASSSSVPGRPRRRRSPEEGEIEVPIDQVAAGSVRIRAVGSLCHHPYSP